MRQEVAPMSQASHDIHATITGQKFWIEVLFFYDSELPDFFSSMLWIENLILIWIITTHALSNLNTIPQAMKRQFHWNIENGYDEAKKHHH